TPRQHNMYSINLNNIVLHRDLTCLVVKASADECMLWHRRLGTKDTTSQEVKKDVSSLRYIALPNWSHDALLEFSSTDQLETLTVETPIPTVSSPVPSACYTNSSEPSSSGNTNPTVFTPNLPADHMETLTVETPIPTISLPVPTAYSTDSQDSSSDARLISKRVANQEETPSFNNILSLANRFKDILRGTTNSDESNGVEADVSNLETTITATPTPILRIYKDHPKSQIIGPVDIQIQTRNKSKEMDVKSAFLYGNINVEVYVMQPPGFQDPEYPDKVYKVEKAISTIDQTLFIKRQRGDFILVQVYMDDIIFGSSNLQLCREFKALMHEKFQMSAMGELNFFLGLQVLYREDGIFLSQDKYVGDILKKFRYSNVRSLNTPMDKENLWGKDGTGQDVDLHLYRSMIRSLMYLTASRPDIMFAVCACSRHQVTPKECHLHAVKRIFRYLKGYPKLGLWYPKDSPFDLVAYSDSDNARSKQLLSMTYVTLSREISTSILHFNKIIARLQFCDYHNMVAILEKGKHNIDFHPMVDFIEASTLRQYTRKARIAQSSALPLVADEPASPMRDFNQGEACPTESDFIADQDRTTIAKSSTLPHDSATRVTSPTTVKGSSRGRNHKLKERVKLLEDGKGMAAEGSRDDAPIKRRSISTGTGVVPTASTTISIATPIFAIATTVTPYTRRRGKEKMVETHTPKKKKRVQEQIDIQFARELEEELEREAQRMNAQISRDEEIAKIHAKKELQQMIAGLNRLNETIAKHLEEYDQAAAELTIRERIELISELVKYQDHHSKILKYQAQQRKTRTKK
nr:hypothetical protein [Tanacetum cinerariifolium]